MSRDDVLAALHRLARRPLTRTQGRRVVELLTRPGQPLTPDEQTAIFGWLRAGAPGLPRPRRTLVASGADQRARLRAEIAELMRRPAPAALRAGARRALARAAADVARSGAAGDVPAERGARIGMSEDEVE